VTAELRSWGEIGNGIPGSSPYVSTPRLYPTSRKKRETWGTRFTPAMRLKFIDFRFGLRLHARNSRE
jgi:hypothetical protein